MPTPRPPRAEDLITVIFDGSTVTATTTKTSATISLKGYSVSVADVGKVLAIRSGADFVIGAYLIVSTDSDGNSWTLDRPCTMGAGDGMIGKTFNQEGRRFDPVREYFDANLPNNPGQGSSGQTGSRRTSFG